MLEIIPPQSIRSSTPSDEEELTYPIADIYTTIDTDKEQQSGDNG
jgi:hypothetical protein